MKKVDVINYQGILYKINTLNGENTVEVADNRDFRGVANIAKEVIHEGIKYKVVKISDVAFLNNSSLNGVTLPNGITSIGEAAFRGCYALTSIRLPNSITSISDGAFMHCSSLSNITLPNSITSIGKAVFRGCKALTSIHLPNSITSISDDAFLHCSSLSNVTFPNGISSIGKAAFMGCKALTSIRLPNSITSISYGAFMHCSSLSNVTLPNGITSISDGAFLHCLSLSNVTFPNGISSIGEAAFRGCKALTSIRLPNSITSISDDAFMHCSSLSNVTFPNGITSIGETAFLGCDALDSIILPDSLTSIGECAFCNCANLISIISDIEDVNSVTMGSKVFYNVHKTTCILKVPASKVDDYKNADQWKEFTTIIENDYAPVKFKQGQLYYEIIAVDKVKVVPQNNDYPYWNEADKPMGCIAIPNTVKHGGMTYKVTSIGKEAFAYCSGVTFINLGENVTTTESYAFSYCNGLNSVTIPNSITTIGEYSFAYCSNLRFVVIPNSVKNIEQQAFAYCSSLIYIISKIENINNVTMGGNVFLSVNKDMCTLTVPTDKITTYKTANEWKEFAIITDDNSLGAKFKKGNLYYIVTAIDKVTVVSQNSDAPYWDATEIPTGAIIIPKSVSYNGTDYNVTAVGEHAFDNCDGLTSVVIPNSVISIGKESFASCDGLTTLSIPNTVTSIGDWAFMRCYALESITSEIENINSVTMGIRVFQEDNKGGCVIKVPTGKVYDYQHAKQWKDFNIITDNNNPLLGKKFKQGKFYYIITGINKVSVVSQNSQSSYWDEAEAPTGEIIIPQTVNYNGVDYNVTTIWNDAFDNCDGLTSVVIPNSVTFIGEDAFYYCSALTSITLPNSITLIGDSAFRECPKLKDFICNATTPPAVGVYAFYNVNKSCALIVPKGCISKYKNAEGWKEFRIIKEHFLPIIHGHIFEQVYSDGVYNNGVGSLNFSFPKEDRNCWGLSFDFYVKERCNHWPLMLSKGWRVFGILLSDSGSISITTNNQRNNYSLEGSYSLNTWHSVSLSFNNGLLKFQLDKHPIQQVRIDMDLSNGDNIWSCSNYFNGVKFKGYLKNIIY